MCSSTSTCGGTWARSYVTSQEDPLCTYQCQARYAPAGNIGGRVGICTSGVVNV